MPSITIPRQARGATGPQQLSPERVSGSTRRKLKRVLAGEPLRRNYRATYATPTALSIIESIPTIVKPTPRAVFGQLAGPETINKPAHRLSPAMGRRLRRRGRNIIQQASLMLKEAEARRARQAREAEAKAKFKPQCSALTRLGTRCRKPSVADGYCATHGA